jgi:hypothetical protein
MGVFSGFFERRRKRESAIQPGNTLTSEPPPPDEPVRPVGQPVEGVGAPHMPLGNLGAGQTMEIGSLFGMMGMIKQAYESGNIQISHGEDHVIDLRGSTGGQELREQIIAAMEQAGINPQSMPEGTEVDASQYAGLQQNIMEVLSQHGVDVNGGASFEVMPDLDGDGKPG